MTTKGSLAFAPFEFDFESTYTAAGWGPGVAWRVADYETAPDEDTDWTGYEVATGNVVAHMIGDDASFSFDPSDLTPLDDLDYCAECGQIGCGHDGRDRP